MTNTRRALRGSPRAYEHVKKLIAESATDKEVKWALGNTDCPQKCHVDPAGACPHGYMSAALAGGIY